MYIYIYEYIYIYCIYIYTIYIYIYIYIYKGGLLVVVVIFMLRQLEVSRCESPPPQQQTHTLLMAVFMAPPSRRHSLSSLLATRPGRISAGFSGRFKKPPNQRRFTRAPRKENASQAVPPHAAAPRRNGNKVTCHRDLVFNLTFLAPRRASCRIWAAPPPEL